MPRKVTRGTADWTDLSQDPGIDRTRDAALCEIAILLAGTVAEETRLIVFRELNANGRLLYRTDEKLEALEADGMIRPMSCDPRTVPGRGVQRKLAANPELVPWAEKVSRLARNVYNHPEFKTSQPRVAKIMAEINGGKDDPDGPCAMTVLRAIARNVENGWHDPCASAPYGLSPNGMDNEIRKAPRRRARSEIYRSSKPFCDATSATAWCS